MKQYKIIPLILTFLTAGNVSAADLDTLKVVDVEEVLVIAAPKENRKLREQPTAVTLLSQQDMQAAQVNSIKNLTGLVPNMFIPDYGSRLTSAVYIRGIGSRINTPSVGLYVDNIPYIDKSAFDFDYSDIERIDVLRGPQGTLYGRNAMGGLIKIHTKSPFSYQGTDLRIGAGTHNAYNTSLTHYHRVSEHFAFSTGGFYDYEGGFFRNAALENKKTDKSQSAGGRFRGIYLPSENWKADLNVSYEYNDQGGYPYYYTGSVNPATQSEEMKSYIGTISNNRESSYYRNLLNTGLNLEYQAQRFTLSAVTGYQFLKDRMFIDQDFTAKDIYTLEQKQRIHTLSEEIVMKSKGNNRWQWATGVFGFYQWLKTDAPVTFREDGMGMLGQMLGSVIPSKIEVPLPMPGMGINILPSLRPGNSNLLINGNFDTPLLNGALFHQSTFRDLFDLTGLSFTAGLRLDYFSFVKGIVDSQDLSLNISREMLQKDNQLKLIHNALEKKIKNELHAMLANDREKYESFWKEFGRQLKFGAYSDYGMHAELLRDLLLFWSAKEQKMVTLQEYVDKMPAEQKYIYFAAGDSTDRLAKLPAAELVMDKGYDVLLLTEDVDEFCLQIMRTYPRKDAEGKDGTVEFKNVNSGDLGLETEDEKKAAEEATTANKALFDAMKDALDGKVKEVKVSTRLKDHPVCLSADGPLSIEMEKVLSKQPGSEGVKSDKVLELNVNHPVFAVLKAAQEAGDTEKLKKYSALLYAQAQLIEGLPVDDPAAYAEAVCSLMQ